jgi:hypothetical protein
MDISPWTLLSRVRTFTVPEFFSLSPTTEKDKEILLVYSEELDGLMCDRGS